MSVFNSAMQLCLSSSHPTLEVVDQRGGMVREFRLGQRLVNEWTGVDFMVLRVGIDIVEIARIERALKNSGNAFLDRVISPAECAEIAPDPDAARVAGIWASKEAAVKALGTGFRDGITFHDIRIAHDELGAPHYVFSGAFKKIMADCKLDCAALSISHCGTHAVAVAVLS